MCTALRSSSVARPGIKHPHTTIASRCRRSGGIRIVAFKESDKTATDWRVQQMIAMSRKYYDNIWSKGNLDTANEILADQVLYKDMANNPPKVVVGKSHLQELIRGTREVYPDLFYEIEQIGFCDSSHVFVQWTAEATNLGNYHGHKATHHHSKWSGVDLVGFNADRSKISDIMVYRQQTNEEQQESHGTGRGSGVVSFEDRYELRLPRLHWEANELRVPE